MAELNGLTIVYDLDKTLCTKKEHDQSYLEVLPLMENVNILNELHASGAEIIIDSARNMVTQSNDESKVIKHVGLDTMNWLDIHNVQYDGLRFAKPYGHVYIDDKALRPREFKKIYDSLKDKSDLNELRKAIEKYLEEN